MKRYLTALFLFGLSCLANAQMPTIVLFPSDAWMKEHQYGENVTTNGRSKWVSDYNKAFDNENTDRTDISTALSTTSATLSSHRLQVQDLKGSMDAQGSAAQDADEMGFDTEEYNQQVIPDIRVEMNWGVSETMMAGRMKKYYVKMQAKDFYTGDILPAVIDESTDFTAENLQSVLQRVINSHTADFVSGIHDNFDQTIKYGRNVRVIIGTRGGLSFRNDQMGGKAMKYYFNDVMKSIANNGVANLKKDGDHLQEYRVRIKLGRKLEDIAQELEAQFASAEFPIQVKTTGVGSMAIAVGQ
jgi:hypothetical protein